MICQSSLVKLFHVKTFLLSLGKQTKITHNYYKLK